MPENDGALTPALPLGSKRCQYGVYGACGAMATTKRRRPTGAMWDVCERHAEALDRIKSNVTKHRDLLERLADG